MFSLTRVAGTCLLILGGLTGPLGAADVREFGAVGDGTTDDTAAVERAVRQASDGVVEFPRGDYRITRTIEIDLATHGRRSLDGGGGVGRVIMAGAGPAFRFTGTHTGTAGPSSFEPNVWQGQRMPQVDGLEIIGDHPQADGIEFVRVMQPTLHGVLLRELRHGVRLSERNRNLLIDACHVYHNRGIGIFFDEVNLHQAIIQGSHISYNKGGGIKIVGGEIRNFQITGNDIEYNYDTEADASADIWFDVRDGSVAEGTIASNTIQARPSPGGANIRFHGPERPEQRARMGLWSITGNLIGNQTTNVHLENCRGITLTGNHIYTGKERTILVEASRHIVIGANSLDQSHNFGRDFANGITVRDSDGVVLSGLILDRAKSGSADAGGAIEILNSRETTVTDCQIFDPKYRGIFVADSRNTRLADNTILQRGAEEESTKMIAAIEVAEDARNTVITGNLVGEGSRGDVIAEAESTVVGENPPAVP